MWRVSDGTAVLTVPGLHAGGLSSLTLLQLTDGTPCALSGGCDGALRVTALADGASRGDATDAHGGVITACCASREGGRAYSAGVDGTAKLWILTTSSGMASAPAAGSSSQWSSHLRLGATAAPDAGPMTCAELARDGTLLLTACASGCVHSWRGADLSAVHELWGHSGPVRSLALSHEHEVAVTTCADGTLRIWRLHSHAVQVGASASSGQAAHVLTVPPGPGGDVADEPTCCALSSDGSVTYVGYGSGALRAWRTSDGVCIKTCPAAPFNPAAAVPALAPAPVTAIGLAHAEDRLVAASADGTTRLVRCSDLRVTHALVGFKQGVTCVALAKDGHYVCAAGMEGVVRAWRVGAPPPLVTFSRAACLTVDARTPGCIPQNLSKAVATAVAKASKELAPGGQTRQQAAAAVKHAVGAAQASAHALAAALRDRGVAVPTGLGKPQAVYGGSDVQAPVTRFSDEVVVDPQPVGVHHDSAEPMDVPSGSQPDFVPAVFPVPRAYDATAE